MNTMFRRAGVFMIAAMALGVAAAARARSLPASTGQSLGPEQATCFHQAGNLGQVENTCSFTNRFCVPLVVDSTWHDVVVTVTAPDINHNVNCFAETFYPDSSFAMWSGFQAASQFGAGQTLVFTGLSVPGGGYMLSCCDVAPNAWVDSFNYSN